jgi:hypothetical protein
MNQIASTAIAALLITAALVAAYMSLRLFPAFWHTFRDLSEPLAVRSRIAVWVLFIVGVAAGIAFV